MSFSINTNVTSLQAQNYLTKSSEFQAQTINEVTSGLRIVNSGDDAAGLAVANSLASDQAVLTQGVQNANNGLATLQTIDGGLSNINTLLDRAQTLATESASGTFSGNRNTLNTEFQSVLTEIDRQSQAIGLNQGGQFAKALSVYIGGGQGTSATAQAANGTVNIDLSQSAVDSKSLGLKGVQAEGNTAVDLSTSSATSVSAIATNATNTASEAVSGFTTFSFKGPAFSDGNAVSISVNLNGVTDASSLATAINSSITAAGSAGTTASTSFKNAGITANVVTDSNGAQHLAFSSATSAFSVTAGDKTSNALLGNIATGSTGAALNTSYAGAGTLGNLTTTTAAQAETVKLQVQGGGLTSPATISVNIAKGDTLSTVMTNLDTAVAGNAALAKAGITLDKTASVAGGKLTFQSTSGQQFSVLSGGDTQNMLGLGTRQLDASGNVQYATTTASTAYSDTTKSGTSNLEFSFNGAASNGATTAIAVNLAAGDATAGTLGGGTAPASGTVNTSAANQLTLMVDGTKHVVDLTTGSHNGATESLAQVATDITSALGAAGSATVDGSGKLLITSASKGVGSAVTVVTGGTGDASAALGLNTATATAGLSRTGGDIANYVNQQIAQSTTLQGAGLTASFASGKLTVDSTNGTQFQLNAFTSASSLTTATVTGTAAGTSGALTGATLTGGTATITSANQNLAITVDNTTYQVKLATGIGVAGATIASSIQSQLQAAGSTATASFNTSNQLVITSGTSGASSAVTIGTQTNPSDADFVLGLPTASSLNNGAAAIATATGAPTSLTISGANNTLNFKLDGGTTLTATIGSATYGSNALLQAAVQSAIDTAVIANGGTTGQIAVGLNGSSELTLTDNTGAQGSGSTIQILAGTANANLNLTTATSTGTNASFQGSVVTGASVTFDSTNNVLKLAVDGQDRTVTFGAGITSLAQVATQINTQLNTQLGTTGLTYASVTGGASNQLTIASNGTGTVSNITFGTRYDEFDGSSSVGLTAASGAVATSGATNYTVASSNNTLSFKVDGGATQSVTVASGTYTTAASFASAIQSALTAASITGITAGTDGSGHVSLSNAIAGTSHSLQIVTGGANDISGTLGGVTTAAVTGKDADLGFGALGSSFTGNTQSANLTAAPNVLSGGAYQSAGYTFSALANGSDTQIVNVSAIDSTGVAHTKNITLQNNTGDQSGATIDQALSKINTQLQQSNDPTLQGITAVKYNDGANGEKIAFVSGTQQFNVTVGSTGSGTGISGGGATVAATVSNGGSTANISSSQGAVNAIAALSAAVAQFGTAQAAVGRGENNLNYAVNLAQSQLTNEASAESTIKDANLAVEAANLTKAQILVQAGTAALAQANSAPQQLLSLLQGH